MSVGLNLSLSLLHTHTRIRTHTCHWGCSYEAYVILSPCFRIHTSVSLSESHAKGCVFCWRNRARLKGIGWLMLRETSNICTMRTGVENKKQKLIPLCWWVVLTNRGTITVKNKVTHWWAERKSLCSLCESMLARYTSRWRAALVCKGDGEMSVFWKVRPWRMWRMGVLWWGWNLKCSLVVLKPSWHFLLSISFDSDWTAERTNLSVLQGQQNANKPLWGLNF